MWQLNRDKILRAKHLHSDSDLPRGSSRRYYNYARKCPRTCCFWFFFCPSNFLPFSNQTRSTAAFQNNSSAVHRISATSYAQKYRSYMSVFCYRHSTKLCGETKADCGRCHVHVFDCLASAECWSWRGIGPTSSLGKSLVRVFSV